MARWIALALLVAGSWLTVRGAWDIGLPLREVKPEALAWGAIAALMLVAVFVAGLRPLAATGLIGFLFAVGTGQAGPLLVVAVFTAASVVSGSWVLRRLGALRDVDAFLLPFIIGAGALGTLCGLAARWPVNYPGVYGVVLALPLLLDRRRCVRWFHARRDWLCGGGVGASTGHRLLECAIGVVALVHFAVAFLPELGFDALAMHLFIADRMRAAHRWTFDVDTYVWAVMPMLVDWVYAIVNMLGGETAARLVNVAFVFTLGGLLRELVLWAGGSRDGARWAVLLFLITPLTFTESNALFIEAGWSVFVVAGTWSVLRALADAGEFTQLLPAAGLMFGFALASKAVTLSLLPALFALIACLPRRWLSRPGAMALGKAALLGLLAGGIPYAMAWLVTANPVFPFFNGIFKSPWYPPENFEAPPFERYLSWNTLYRVTFESGRYMESKAGVAGFQWLLLFVPAAVAAVAAQASRWRTAALLVVGIGGVAAVFQQTAYLRYVFPCVVVLVAVIGVGMTYLAAGGWRSAPWVVAAVVAVGLNGVYFHAGAGYHDLPLLSAFTPRARTELIAERKPERLAVPAVNALNGPASPVMWIAQAGAAGLDSDVLYAQWYNHRFAAEFNATRTEEQMALLMGRRGVEFAVYEPQVRSPAAFALIAATDEVANVGGVSLRRLKSAWRFAKELAASPDFHDASAWSLGPGATIDGAGLELQANTGASQKIRVTEGRKYLNSVSARCAGADTLGRLQVNWVDASQKMVSTSGKVYSCGPDWAVYEQEVTAPTGAAFAMLYAWDQAGGPLTIRLNSLKGSP